jgi:hypothetical protein
MSIPSGPSAETPPPRPRQRRSGWSLRLTPGGVVVLLLLNLLILALLAIGMNTLIRWFPENTQGTQPSQITTTPTEEIQNGVPSQATSTPTNTQITSPISSPTSPEQRSSLTPSPTPSASSKSHHAHLNIPGPDHTCSVRRKQITPLCLPATCRAGLPANPYNSPDKWPMAGYRSCNQS